MLPYHRGGVVDQRDPPRRRFLPSVAVELIQRVLSCRLLEFVGGDVRQDRRRRLGHLSGENVGDSDVVQLRECRGRLRVSENAAVVRPQRLNCEIRSRPGTHTGIVQGSAHARSSPPLESEQQ
jgi:hypothetical protein